MLNYVRKTVKSFLVWLNNATLPPQQQNLEYNRRTWDRYARFWRLSWTPLENANVSEEQRKAYRHLGVEWGNMDDVERVIAEFIHPYVTKESVAGEIGSGGGRVASLVAGRVREFYCFDISAEMLKRVKQALAEHAHVHYVLLPQPKFPPELDGKFDFLYSFDVFVHLDLHVMWSYFQAISRALKPAGRAFIHTANLKAPDGWKRFASQTHFTVQGHYFVSPEMVRILAGHAGLKIVKESQLDASSFYLNRDYLVVLEKP